MIATKPAFSPDPMLGWIPSPVAAPLMNLNPDHLGRLCRQEIAATGFAVLAPGPGGQFCWWIHRSYSPALQGDERKSLELPSNLDQFTGKQRENALLRKMFVERLRDARANAPRSLSMATIIEKIVSQARDEFPDLPISRSALLQWDHDYAHPSDLETLVDKRGRPDETAASPEAWKALADLYLHANAPSLKFCWRQVGKLAAEAGWKWMTYSACHKRLNAEIPKEKQIFNRQPAVYRKTMTPFLRQDIEAWAAGENWIFDHKQLDFWCILNGRLARLWATVIMDWRTQKVVGWWIAESPSTDTVIAALATAMLDESNMGGCRRATLDNGRDFASFALNGSTKAQRRGKMAGVDTRIVAGIFSMLGIDVHFCQKFSPNSKGRLERFFRNLGDFCKTFSTYCGAKSDDKPETLNALLASGQAIPTFAEVEKRFGDFICGYNANADHAMDDLMEDGMRLSPCGAYAKWCDTKIVYADPDAVREILGGRQALCSVTRNGIALKVDGQTYYYGQYSSELADFKAQKRADRERVFATFTADDMSEIRVWTQDWKFICFAGMNGVGGGQISREAIAKDQRDRRHYLRGQKHVAEYSLLNCLTPEERARDAQRRLEREAAAARQTAPYMKMASTPMDGQPRRQQRQRVKAAVGASAPAAGPVIASAMDNLIKSMGALAPRKTERIPSVFEVLQNSPGLRPGLRHG